MLSPGTELLLPTSSELDLRDEAAVQSFLTAHAPDVVIHTAGRVGGISANVREPVAFLRDNMLIGMHVIHCAAEAGVPRLFNFGSSCMYPKDHKEILSESDLLQGPLEPTNEGYAIAKLAADKLCEYVSQECGYAYRTVIPSNLYGPHDHFDRERGHIVASAIDKVHHAAIHRSPTVEIWGDGTARREFTYARDVTDWLVQALPSLEDLPLRMNLGMGVDFTVTEYYRAVAGCIGYDGDFTYDTSRPTGMRRKLMDSSQARHFGWAPKTDLNRGLELTYQFYRKMGIR